MNKLYFKKVREKQAGNFRFEHTPERVSTCPVCGKHSGHYPITHNEGKILYKHRIKEDPKPPYRFAHKVTVYCEQPIDKYGKTVPGTRKGLSDPREN